MTPAQKRALFPLSAPRWQTLAFLPFHTLAAAVDGYFEALLCVYDASRCAGPASGRPPASGLRAIIPRGKR